MVSRGLPPCDHGAALTPAALSTDLARIRETGYEVDDGSWMPGLRSVAVPILDAGGQATAAITVVGFSERMNQPTLDEIIGQLRDSADEISAQLGFRGPMPGADDK